MRDAEGNEEISALKRLIFRSERIVALTGAGISTESGIPDFRSPGGLWTRGIKPITYQDFVASEEARLEDWRRRFKMNADFAAAEPNAGHLGLARLAKEGRLLALVTQNIDGLHQRAGVPLRSRDRDPRQLDSRALPRLPCGDAARRPFAAIIEKTGSVAALCMRWIGEGGNHLVRRARSGRRYEPRD